MQEPQRDKYTGGRSCTVCHGQMHPHLLPGTFRCSRCGFQCSNFTVEINAAQSGIDEHVRARALRPVRQANFEQLLSACTSWLPAKAQLLDVGSAHGWFLERASARNYAATGIEPDLEMVEYARSAGQTVVAGFFPDALDPDATFDALVFNDVFEHLPDVFSMAQAISRHLTPGGVAIINLPVIDGLIFRVAEQLARFGFTAPLARLWQRGWPSPHLSYFSIQTLPTLTEQAGLRCVQHGPLDAVALEGLMDRIRYDRQVSWPAALLLYAGMRTLHFISRWQTSDIHYFVFQSTRSNQTTQT